MQSSVCAGKLRGGEDLSHGNIHIRYAVFENGFLFRMLQLHQLHLHIRPVCPGSFDMHIFPLIQGVNQFLLNALVQTVIQVIDLLDFPENLLKVVSNLRDGPGDDGKASLISGNITVYQLAGLAAVVDAQLLLLLIESQSLLTAPGQERLFPENLHNRRTGVNRCQILVFFIGCVQNRQTPFHQLFVQIKGRVLLVVKHILLAGGRAAVACVSLGTPVDAVPGLPVNNTLKPHFLKLLHSSADYPLKSQGIADVDRLLSAQINPCVHKPNPVSFRKGGSHGIDLLLGKSCQEPACLQLIFRNILTEPVQISGIV